MKYINPIIGFIVITISIFTTFVFNDVFDEVPVQCQVLDKVHVNDKYGSLYLVVKDDRGKLFDILVSPASYSQCKIGYIYTFNLTKGFLGINKMPNWLFGWGIFLGIIAIFWIIFTWPDSSKSEPVAGGSMTSSTFVTSFGANFLS